MPLSPGDKLGPYEILSPLGEGGMGQVWKARDTRLNRFVAIKTSHQHFSERFEREAQAIAALNHPHICSLYDIGPDYLVMEYVEGKPLQGPVPIQEALTLAGEMLDALDAAHRKGITHRDLKPGNILLGKNGVKILDFGLAKIEHAPTVDGATMTMPLTGAGSIMGTLQYMAPEQLEGKEADARSDIFAFGLVLYELISGARAYAGTTQATIIASILKDQPRPLHELQPLASSGLERVLQTCLEKDPDKRWQSAREVKHALEWMAQATPAVDQARVAEPRPKGAVYTLAAIAALLGLIAIGLAGWMFWPKTEPPAPITRFQVPLPDNVTFGQYVSLSPDGRKLVINTSGDPTVLWIRDLDALEWRRLPGTEGGASPFWSPDSRFLAFAVGNQIKKIDISGGPPQTLCTVPMSFGSVGSGSWSRDGVIVFGGRGTNPLWKVSQSGGVATQVTSVDPSLGESFHALPVLMPDGKHFIYFRTGTPERMGVYGGSLDAKPAEQPKTLILASGLAASYANGSLFFWRDNTLMAQPFDAGRLQLKGEPVPVAEHVDSTGRTGVFSISASGALAFRTVAKTGNFQLTWFDREGKTLSNFGEPGQDILIKLSPDGTRGAVRDAGTSTPGDLWTLDFASGRRTRFTFQKSFGSWAVWSPDGSRIAFSAGTIFDTVYEKSSSGASDEKELLKEPNKLHLPTSWSRDGKFMLYFSANTTKTGEDLWVLPLQGDRKPVLLLATEFNEEWATFSPDMRWIAYDSNESGRFEVYVRPFLASGPSGAPSFGEGKWQVSKDGGAIPVWRADGKEVFFQGAPGGSAKMAVDVKANGSAFEAAVPRRLFLGPADDGWDVTPDGKRFLLAAPQLQQAGPVPITVVLNWPALLKK
jgi:serine/threonine protein kinase/Tol biopolymer transport system component